MKTRAVPITIEIIEPSGRQQISFDRSDLASYRAARRKVQAAPRGAAFSLEAALPRWTLRERLSSRPEALGRIEQIVRAAADNLSPLPFAAKPVAVDSEPDSPLARTLEILESHDYAITGPCIRALRELGTWPRTMILTQDADSELCYTYIGDGLVRRLGGHWSSAALGQRHDFDFGSTRNPYYLRSSAQYQQVVASGEPLRHHVDSLIPNHDGSGPPARVNYDRLMLRVTMLDGSAALFMASQVRPMLLPLVSNG